MLSYFGRKLQIQNPRTVIGGKGEEKVTVGNSNSPVTLFT